MNTKIKHILFFGLVIALLGPSVQMVFNIFNDIPIYGAFYKTKKPEFSIESWFSGDYQQQFNQSVEDNIGFRGAFIKLKNQLDYWLFGTVRAAGVVIGKDEVLFQDFYIDAYLGNDFVGEDILKTKIKKLGYVQKELEKKGITIIFLIAPGKASFYPEYLPNNVSLHQKRISNYDYCSKEMTRIGINLIDMKKYLISLKDTSKYPLFPKCGTHWSGYAITLVTDTLTKYIEKKLNIDLPDCNSSSGYSTSTDFKFTDNDIGQSMNLLWDIPSWKVYYPTISFFNNSKKTKPDLLSIGDSFNQSFFGFYPYFNELFGPKTQYWYYNKVLAWPDSFDSKYISVESLNLKREIELRKIILIVSTEQNLKDFGFGFIDNAYMLYDSTAMLAKEERVSFYKTKIKNDPKWLESIAKKSKDKDISIEEMIEKDAQWLYEQEEMKILDYEARIKSDPNWLASVKKKAEEKNIDLQKMIRLDAIWMVEQEKLKDNK